MKRTLLFISCMLAALTMSAQEDPNDYIPFVELGKQWYMVSHNGNPSSPGFYLRHWMSEEVERDGKIYAHTFILANKLNTNEQNTWHDCGLFREENRRVYKFDEEAGRDFILYDFSLKEGDVFTYDLGYGFPMNCKVLKQGWLYDGPKIVSYTNPASADTLETKYRRLRTWTIGLDNGTGEYHEITTWVEGVGALKNIFKPLVDGGRICLAYVERNDRTGYWENEYLPFSFCNNQLYGCNLPTGAEAHSADGHHQLTYELEGDRLHVYGEVFCNCGPNHYAYFCEKPTDDPSVHKIEFITQDVEPLMWCVGLHATNFYVPGFDPNLNYIVVDNQGVEHPVINTTPQMAYRPFVEDGKVWKVGNTQSILDNVVQVVDYYYFDGDTIVGGKTCKQMMCQRYVSPDHSNEYWTPTPSLSKVGAWYEEDKKVYFYDERKQAMVMKYDFSLAANDTLQFLTDWSSPFIIGPKQTGGIEGFKGVYRDIRMCGDEGKSYHDTFWLEGVGCIRGPISSPCNPILGDPMPEFLMSCTVGDEVIYLIDYYEDGATPEAARKQRIDFTHTVKIKPQSRTTRGTEASLYGEYNDQQLGINLDPLDETYLVRITDEAGKAVYEKTVNAGNIVGLNIDISNYAEGRYTVTVENSNESFTAQFDTQTTSISLTPALSHREGAIYNLQGQRISSLRKGLNIVNGRKVFVKE